MLIKIRDNFPTATYIRGADYSPGGVYEVDEEVYEKLKSRIDPDWAPPNKDSDGGINPPDSEYQSINLSQRFGGKGKDKGSEANEEGSEEATTQTEGEETNNDAAEGKESAKKGKAAGNKGS